MTSAFKEFSSTYREFREQFPRHPLTEEIRGRLGNTRVPNDQWLKSRTKRMKDLMLPLWMRPKSGLPNDNRVASLH